MRALPLLAAFLLIPSILTALSREDSLYRSLKSDFRSGNYRALSKSSKNFFRMYPSSPHVPDIRMMLAEIEPLPDKAIYRYRVLVDKYRYYRRRDYAQLQICRLHYLQSQWISVVKETQKARKLFPESGHFYNYSTLLLKSLVFLGRYGEAQNIGREILKSRHSPDQTAAVLLVMAHIEKKISGSSRSYVFNLSRLVSDFGNSESAPTALYLLGKYYEKQHDPNRAYSAFVDITEKYPRSPEAIFASRKIARLKSGRPRKVPYLPTGDYINKLDSIDLKPEIDIHKSDRRNTNISYAVSLGPFENLRHALAVKGIIEKDFSPLFLVKSAPFYRLYVGKSPDREYAAVIKIRLAEEYGINGTVVRISGDSPKKYIYGE